MLRVPGIRVIHLDGDGAAVAVPERGLERLGESLLHVRANAQPVDDDLDRVLGVLRKLRHRVDLVDGSVDAYAHEAFRAELVARSFELAGGRGPCPPRLTAIAEVLHAGSLIIDDIEDASRCSCIL